MPLMPVEQALAQIRAEAGRLPAGVERVAVARAHGRVLAAALHAPSDLPRFDNSAMDGYALRGAALAGSEFAVGGEIAAGDPVPVIETGIEALTVNTGAPLPAGFSTVVPHEEVEVVARDGNGRASRIRLKLAVAEDQHRRRAGEDLARGAPVLPAGHRLRTLDLPVLRALGIERISVRKRPGVAVLSTGNELAAPGAALSSGQIHDSNGLAMRLLLEAAGARVVATARLPDDPQAFAAALAQARAAGARLVVSSGAVSMGSLDFVPKALVAAGATVHCHKLAMRPGKPLLFATLADGTPYFGLPGNPAAALVGTRFFVAAALAAMLGQPDEVPWSLPLAEPVASKPALTLYQKARLVIPAEGRVQVRLLPGQQSFRIAPLLAADAWAVLPAGASALAAGQCVDVYPLEPLSPPLETAWT